MPLQAYEAAHLQHVEVRNDGREAHRKRLGELARRGRDPAQAHEDRRPGDMGERVERLVEEDVGSAGAQCRPR